MLLKEIFSIPDNMRIQQIPTETDSRGYVDALAIGMEFRWGSASIRVSDIAEFSDHVTFTLERKYSVIIYPDSGSGHPSEKKCYSCIVIGLDDDTVILDKDCQTKRQLYEALKELKAS